MKGKEIFLPCNSLLQLKILQVFSIQYMFVSQSENYPQLMVVFPYVYSFSLTSLLYFKENLFMDRKRKWFMWLETREALKKKSGTNSGQGGAFFHHIPVSECASGTKAIAYLICCLHDSINWESLSKREICVWILNWLKKMTWNTLRR